MAWLQNHALHLFHPPQPEGEQYEVINYLELPVGDRAPEVFRAVIEIPLDGTQKFEYNCSFSRIFERANEQSGRLLARLRPPRERAIPVPPGGRPAASPA